MSDSPRRGRFGRIVHPFIIVLAIPVACSPKIDSTVNRDAPASTRVNDDPRIKYTGPFKNIEPDAVYVSEESCTKCHNPQAKTYCQHPMARTLRSIEQVQSPPLSTEAFNPFDALGQQFQVLNRDGRVWHARSARDHNGKSIFHQEIEAQYAVGSGTHAHSYLSIRDHTVLQTPITWYEQKKRWDLSPGFQHNVLAGRRVALDCLFCHSNGAREDPADELRVIEPVFPNGLGIGCQRCHGPGSEHVKNPGHFEQVKHADLNDIVEVRLDPTIVNPAHLTPMLREAVCWQCHLEGDVRVQRRGRQRYDFRPGLPLESFVAVFDDPTDATYDHVVNHVEQMVQSQCYKKSSGPKQMGCVSCHDPHEKPPPEKQTAFYRKACLNCHKDKSCSLPLPQRLAKNREDSCVACHMTSFATSNVQHVSSTDHRVPRKPLPRHIGDGPIGMRMGPIHELVSVFEHHNVKNDPEVDRDKALASAILTRIGRPLVVPMNREFEEAIERNPDDLPVKVQYALLLANRNEWDKAMPLLEDILARQPDNEDAQFGYALICWKIGRYEEAAQAWKRLIERTPSQRGYRLGFISMLNENRRWREAASITQAWIDYDPGIPEARFMMRNLLKNLGKMAEAEEQDRIGRDLMPKQ